MARIGLGEWGQNVPAAPTGGARPPEEAFVQRGPGLMGDALERTADSAAGADIQVRREQEAELKHQDRERVAEAKRLDAEAKRTAALRSTTDFGNDIADMHDGLKIGLSTGKIKPETLLESFDEQAGKLKERYASTVAPEVSEAARIHMDNAYRDTRRKLGIDLENHRRDQMVADFGATREGLERRAVRDLPGAQMAYEATARTILKDAGFSDTAIEKDVQAFKEKTSFTHAATIVNAAANNPRALAAAGAVLADPKQYPDMDPEKRRILSAHVATQQETLRVRAEREADRRDRALEREMNAISRLSLQGINAPPERLAQLSAAVRGTPYAAEFKAYVDGLEDQRKFVALPPDQQRAALEADVAAVAKGGGNEGDRLRIQRRQQTYELTVNQLTQDPLAYAARTSGQEIPPIDFAKPETIPATLKARADILVPLNQSHGANVALFRPDEAMQLRQMMRSLDASKRAGILGTLYSSVKDRAPAVYNATLAQLAPDSPVTAMAGHVIAAGDVTIPRTFGADTKIDARDLSARLLRGEDLLNPARTAKSEDGKPPRGGPMAIKEADFSLQFNNLAGNAFAGPGAAGVRSTYFQAAKAVYADLSAEAGDFKGEVSPARVRQAWDMVTGGGTVNFNGTRVLAPLGMSSDALRPRVVQEFARLREEGRTELPGTAINSAQLRQLEPGVYAILSGGRMVPDAKNPGEPLVIDITGGAPAPARRSSAPDVADLRAGPAESTPRPEWGKRQDGTAKGAGFLGVLKTPAGDVASEYTIGVKINGKEVDVPTLVPTLTRPEVEQVLRAAGDRTGKTPISDTIERKAREFAEQRIRAGKSVFAGPDESPGYTARPTPKPAKGK